MAQIFLSFVSPHMKCCHHPQGSCSPSLPLMCHVHWELDPLSQHTKLQSEMLTTLSPNSLRMLHWKIVSGCPYHIPPRWSQDPWLITEWRGISFPLPSFVSCCPLFGEVHSLSLTSHSWTPGLLLHSQTVAWLLAWTQRTVLWGSIPPQVYNCFQIKWPDECLGTDRCTLKYPTWYRNKSRKNQMEPN